MSYFITNYCFFTGKVVVSTTPPGSAVLDGYYYTIWYKGRERAIRLFCDDGWATDCWMQKHGKDFITLIDTFNNWAFFNIPRDLATIQFQYGRMKTLRDNNPPQKKQVKPVGQIKVA